MKIKSKCKQFELVVTNDADETLYAVAFTDYAVELDVSAIINEVGAIKALVDSVKAALIQE